MMLRADDRVLQSPRLAQAPRRRGLVGATGVDTLRVKVRASSAKLMERVG